MITHAYRRHTHTHSLTHMHTHAHTHTHMHTHTHTHTHSHTHHLVLCCAVAELLGPSRYESRPRFGTSILCTESGHLLQKPCAVDCQTLVPHVVWDRYSHASWFVWYRCTRGSTASPLHSGRLVVAGPIPVSRNGTWMQLPQSWLAAVKGLLCVCVFMHTRERTYMYIHICAYIWVRNLRTNLP